MVHVRKYITLHEPTSRIVKIVHAPLETSAAGIIREVHIVAFHLHSTDSSTHHNTAPIDVYRVNFALLRMRSSENMCSSICPGWTFELMTQL